MWPQFCFVARTVLNEWTGGYNHFINTYTVILCQAASTDKRKKSSAGRGSKDRQQRSGRKPSRSRSSSYSRSSSSRRSSSRTASSTSSRSRGRSDSRSSRHRRRRRRSRSRSGTSDRHRRDRQQSDPHGHRSNGRRASSPPTASARGGRDYDRFHWHANKAEPALPGSNETTAADSSSAANAPKNDPAKASLPKVTTASNEEKKVDSAPPAVAAQLVSNNVIPVVDSQTTAKSVAESLPPPTVPAAEGTTTTVPRLQMLKTPFILPAPQPQPSSSGPEAINATFSRDSIIRNLQEMVKPPPPAADVPRAAEETQPELLGEKEKSALQFAISMYMAANEFYDGGSLWCRQCNDIFLDISALCRHIHSDKHQLVSDAALLLNSCICLHFLGCNCR